MLCICLGILDSFMQIPKLLIHVMKSQSSCSQNAEVIASMVKMSSSLMRR